MAKRNVRKRMFPERAMPVRTYEGAVAQRDVLFLCHAKPKDAEQEAVWRKLVENTLEPPNTWEVALSAGKGKRENSERLIVITDEQSHDGILTERTPRAYVVTVAPYQHGVNYGNGWTHVDGWSERIVDYLASSEAEAAA
ncbi:MAG: hypothetical protein WA857_17600 [Candidatus Acidiferrum sp.]